ncbi:MAG: Rrf2 family transcriptional regulator [Acidimicrobiia bacterium]|nr:Rrf2 family transcriptional regulator [Acidimicrobiia bacterium]
MRISAKVDYAVRAMAQLAAEPMDEPVKAEDIARAQDIPLKFLLGILNDLKRAYLVRSQRGAEGGYALARPADEITLADIIRVIDGPLANVHDLSLSELSYAGPAKRLREVWMAVRASLRSVLETTTLADLAAGDLPDEVRELASTYQAEERRQRARRR